MSGEWLPKTMTKLRNSIYNPVDVIQCHTITASILFKEATAESAPADDHDTEADPVEDEDIDNVEEVTIVPHTDVPDIIMVTEDEFTEKLDVDSRPTDAGTEREMIRAAVRDNDLNQDLAASRDRGQTAETGVEANSSSQQAAVSAASVEQQQPQYAQPQLEVISAADAVQRPELPQSEVTSSPEAAALEEEARPRARVAFADPTLSPEADSRTPTRAKESGKQGGQGAKEAAKGREAEEEATLTSLSAEDTQPAPVPPPAETAAPDKGTETPAPAPAPAVTTSPALQGESSPSPALELGKFAVIVVFIHYSQII